MITKRDGTKYYFGLNHLPGWASGKAAANSVDSEPVYSSQSGDPCYSSSGFTSSVCTMGYRWHLDYVTDTHGDAMAYYYHQDTNYPNVGLPFSDTYPVAGGLPAETVGHNYLYPFDLPNELSGTIDGYGAGTSYDQYGNVLSETIGTGSNTATITSTYDPHNTQQLTGQALTRNATAPAAVDDEQYKYDLSGNITRQVSTRFGSASTSETQCFNYDALDRLSAAWTATDGCAATPTAASHASVGDGLGTASEPLLRQHHHLPGPVLSGARRPVQQLRHSHRPRLPPRQPAELRRLGLRHHHRPTQHRPIRHPPARLHRARHPPRSRLRIPGPQLRRARS